MELRSFVFACDKAFTSKKLLILIHGSGVVRAGQWARRLIINDNLNSGTQIPYIKKAKQLGYGIIVLNTNDNRRVIKGISKEIAVCIYTYMNLFYYDNYILIFLFI